MNIPGACASACNTDAEGIRKKQTAPVGCRRRSEVQRRRTVSKSTKQTKNGNRAVAQRKAKAGPRICRDGKLRRKMTLELREDVLARLECEGLWAREGVHNLTDMIRWALYTYVSGIEQDADPSLRSELSEARKRAWEQQAAARAEKDRAS